MNYTLLPAGIQPVSSFGDPKWIPGGGDTRFREGQPIDGSRKVKILVIDDEALIAETVMAILNHEGFDATAASNGTDAIQMALEMRPDVVLSDVIMPGLNGVEAGIKIREMLPRCKIILFSGQAATVDLLEKARQEGHDFEILAKPIKPERLISLIRASSERPS